MRWKSVLRYNFRTTVIDILSYYGLVIGSGIFLILINKIQGVNFDVSGLDVFTSILLFIMAMEIFNNSFKMTYGFNIARKEYVKGTTSFLLLLSVGTAIIDVIINRIINIYINSPMVVDTNYGGYLESGTYLDNWKAMILLSIIHLTAIGAGFLISSFYNFCKGLKHGRIIFGITFVVIIPCSWLISETTFFIASGNADKLFINALLDLGIGIAMLLFGFILTRKTSILA